MQRVPYVFDPKLIPRVQKYLEANVDKTYVDIGIMSDELQNTYREYSRRKRNAFRASVNRAYSIVLESYKLDDNPGSSSDKEIEEVGRENSINDCSDENEVIDISSDKEEETQILHKRSNGPLTSMKGIRTELPNNSQVNKDSTFIQGKKKKQEHRQTNQMNNKKKIKNSEVKLDVPQVTFRDLVGIDNIIHDICINLMGWLSSQSDENSLELGYLLHGPPGCGKTLLAHAIAGHIQLPLISVAAPELVDGISGNSEKMIRDLFKRALSASPCVLFIDNIDSITQNKSNSPKDMQKRMIAQMNSCIDQLRKEPMGKKVILIGATSEPDSMDSSLRCGERFSIEIKLGIPNDEGRIAILKKHSSHLNLAPNFDWNLIHTPGYLAGDLRNVVNRVIQNATFRALIRYKKETFSKTNEGTESPNTEEMEVMNKISEISEDELCTLEGIFKMNEIIAAHGLPENLKKCFTVTVEDFEAALQKIKPLYIRDMVCVPKISWDDVGSLKDLKKELMSTFMGTIKHKEQYKALGLGTPGGILLCGPPGCGKTLVAKALANEARLNFISVNGPEMMNMYVGESERAVRACFEKAENSAPCIIFFDEIDALCPKNTSNGQSEVSSRVVAQMLTAMDGVNERKDVFILAATNRPDEVHPPLLRRGRFDKILYVGLPSADDRVEILKAVTRNGTSALGPDVDLESIGKSDKLSGFTGADLAGLVREAFQCSVDRCKVDVNVILTSEDFEKAISKMAPSVSAEDMVIYEEMKQRYTLRSSNELNEKKRKREDLQTNQMNKKKKTNNSEVKLDLPQVTFKDVVGIDNILIGINEDLMAWLISRSNENSLQLGYLLHGPSGCGKTLLAHAIAGERRLPLISVAAPELVDGISDNSEKMIRDLFKRALSASPCVLFIDNIDSITNNRLNSHKDMQKRMIAQMNSCIDQLRKEPMGKKVILIGATSDPDSMDSSLRCRGRFSREIKLGIPNDEGRIAILKKHSSHLNLAPDFDWNLIYTPGYLAGDLRNVVDWVEQKAPSRVMMRYKKETFNKTNEEEKNLITNAISEKDESENNDSEIIVDDDPKDVPKDKTPSANLVLVIEDENSKQEEDISSTLPAETKSTEVPNTEEVEAKNEISEVCEDKVWTLEDISRMNEIIAAHGLPEHLKKCLTVTVEDFQAALQEIKPLYIKEGMVCVPKISWDDVGSLKDLKKELMSTFMGTIKHKEQYKALGLGMPSGVLLCGPPGCGKTLVAKALANEARLNFIAVKGPELMNMYVGESERAVRMCFQRAENSAPCIIFFDEIDALCPKNTSNGQSEVSSRVVAQMLTEMDGVDERKEVFILAATNRPDVVDSTLLRRGRFDKILYVGLPSADDRVDILKTITRNGTPALGPDVDLESIGKSDKLSGYTGADLAALVKQAALCFIDRCGVDNVDLKLTNEDFEKAISKMTPSVSSKDMVIYEEMKQQYTPRSSNELNEQMDLS